MKKRRVQKLFLEQLRKTPIIQVACEKLDVSRVSIHKWRKADPAFDKAVEEALTEGETVLNDLSEAQLISLMKDRHWQPIAFWLSRRHPKFKNTLDITARIEKKEELTPEQQEIVRKALRHAALLPKEKEQKPPEKKSDDGGNPPDGAPPETKGEPNKP